MDERRLSTLLRIRALQRDLAQSDMLVAQRRLEHDRVRHRHAVEVRDDATLTTEALSGAAFGRWAQRTTGAIADVERQHQRVQESDVEHRRLHQTLLDAERRVQGLEKLAERHAEELQRERRHRETVAMDEYVSQRRRP